MDGASIVVIIHTSPGRIWRQIQTVYKNLYVEEMIREAKLLLG